MLLDDGVVVLRAIEVDDCQFLKKIINDPKIEEMVLGWSFPVSTKDQLHWIESVKNDSMTKRYIIEVENKAVGLAVLSQIDFKNSNTSVGIKIDGDVRGKGIGTRVVRLLVKYCFEELNLHCLTATILDYNIPSQRLYEKCGFSKEGVLRNRIYKKGKYHNVFVYSILKEEFN